MAQVNANAEKHITKMLSKKVPYYVRVLDNDFVINSINAYPPGKLTEMFAQFLIDNNLLRDKVIADVGSGCFALGIIAAKNGAKSVVGTDISDYAIKCAKDNLQLNNLTKDIDIFHGDGVSVLLPEFRHKIDVLLSGAPWDSISDKEFKGISDEKKPLSRSFYDVGDKLIISILTTGFELLSPEGRIFITSSKRIIERIKELCLKYKLGCKIVKEEDLHKDGNTHYILEITR